MMPKSLPFILFVSFFLIVVPCIAVSPLSVLVTDGHSPVGGVTVSMLIGGTTYSGLTDSNGLTSFSLPNGSFMFVASKEGYIQGSATANGGDTNATIIITHLYGISGTIVDASTGSPVTSASISERIRPRRTTTRVPRIVVACSTSKSLMDIMA